MLITYKTGKHLVTLIYKQILCNIGIYQIIKENLLIFHNYNFTNPSIWKPDTMVQ